jgi:hypothetical protein
MERQTTRRVEPVQFRKQAIRVGLAGLAMDVVVAAVFVVLHPFERTVSYILAAALVGLGLVLSYVFSVVFPRRYEANYARMYEPRL